ncbi:MAG: D-glycero-beta-D-manno-heptose 1-phosphate adenylyltransferase [Bacteroidia bacterium]|jgi:rfaE bifunctional protein nucleotidyltransferase chain/domain|nr:D-glycero-beta-D-manno-heptose 1-phosphate adenylyltransferase [Bacteroidia bacterium]
MHKQLVEKISDNWQLAKLKIEQWKAKGDTIVFTNGCFDLLHPGHVDYLYNAKSLGDRLIVGLNSDSSVSELKGPSRPIQDEKARAIIMASLGCTDLIVIFNEETPLELISLLKPDILVKGGDYKVEDIVGYTIVQENGGKVLTLDFLPGYSTSAIEKKIRNS